MQIPRQSDGRRAPGAVPADAAAGLRTRRRHLVEQLRSVGYWQRLVQARTDLLVAGLLYAAPVPAAVPPGGGHPCGEGDGDLAGLASPPEGVDVAGLLAGTCAAGPGAHLDRLREVSLVLVRRSRALQEELDTVTSALHAQLALDGAGEAPAGDAVPGVERFAGTGDPVTLA